VKPQPNPDLPESLLYRNEDTGEVMRLDDALNAGWLNLLTYERDMEVIAGYGVEDPGDGDGLWPL